MVTEKVLTDMDESVGKCLRLDRCYVIRFYVTLIFVADFIGNNLIKDDIDIFTKVNHLPRTNLYNISAF